MSWIPRVEILQVNTIFSLLLLSNVSVCSCQIVKGKTNIVSRKFELLLFPSSVLIVGGWFSMYVVPSQLWIFGPDRSSRNANLCLSIRFFISNFSGFILLSLLSLNQLGRRTTRFILISINNILSQKLSHLFVFFLLSLINSVLRNRRMLDI